MTAVHPAYGVTRKTNEEMFFTKTSIAIVDEGSRNEKHGIDISEISASSKTGGDGYGVMAKSLSPLLTSMRLCGQYFIWPFNKSKKNCEAAAIDNRIDVTKAGIDNVKYSLSQKVLAIYAVAVTIILWVNALRLLMIFTPNDKTLLAFVMKIMVVTWNAQCAVQHTAYVLASVSGRLERVLNDIQLNSASCDAYVRRLSAKFALVTWILVIADVAFVTYYICFSDGLMDASLAPFGTYISVSHMEPIRVAYVIVSFHVHPAWCFPVAMTFMLSFILAHQFRNVADGLRRMLKDPECAMGVSDCDIEEIRQQHHMLCRSIHRADRFLKFYHVAAFFGPLIIIIAILYAFIIHPEMFKNSFIVIFIYTFWLGACVTELSLIAGGGIMVNHYVCTIGQRIFVTVER
jgi:hypothetical protein